MVGTNSRTRDRPEFEEFCKRIRQLTNADQMSDDEFRAACVMRAKRDSQLQSEHQQWINNIRHSACGVGRPVVFVGDYKAGATRRYSRGGGVPSKFFFDEIASQFITTLMVDEAYTSKRTFKGKLSRVAEAADFGKDKMLLPNKRMFAIDGAKRPDEGVLLLDRDVSGSAMRRMFGVC